jgi:hypothetical protein
MLANLYSTTGSLSETVVSLMYDYFVRLAAVCKDIELVVCVVLDSHNP